MPRLSVRPFVWHEAEDIPWLAVQYPAKRRKSGKADRFRATIFKHRNIGGSYSYRVGKLLHPHAPPREQLVDSYLNHLDNPR